MPNKLLQSAWIRTLTNHIPPGQLGRYLAVGACNTVFGYGTYALLTALLGRVVPHGYIWASIISAPVNFTFSYLNYKWFVFRTRGNYLREWARSIVVYSTSMALGVILLPPVVVLIRWTSGLDRSAPYLGGALLMGFGVIYSFLGHKNFSFRPRETSAPR